MNRKPIALKGWDQRSDLSIDARDNGSEGNGKEGKGGNEDADDLLPVFEFENQIDQDDGPGEKDERFVHVGQGDITVSCLVGLDPAKDESSRMEEQAEEQEISREGPRPITPSGRKDKIAQRTDEIDGHRNIEKSLA
jgi:hypothetical protein